MFGRPVMYWSALPPPGAIRATAARVPMGPEPPKFVGSGTLTSPGGPDSATYSVPSGPNAIPFGLKRPLAYTDTVVGAAAACVASTADTASAANSAAEALSIPFDATRCGAEVQCAGLVVSRGTMYGRHVDVGRDAGLS